MQPGLPFQPDYPPPVFVRHPRARRYVVSVRDNGGVRVTLPRWGSLREAREFFSRLDGWIDRQRRRLEVDRSAVPLVPSADPRSTMERARRALPPRLLELARDLRLQ